MYDRVLWIQDVHDFDAADTERVGDQGPVAAPPHRFRAHQYGPPATAEFEQYVQSYGNSAVPM